MATKRKASTRSTKGSIKGGTGSSTAGDYGTSLGRSGGDASPAEVMGNVTDPGPVTKSDVAGPHNLSRSFARAVADWLTDEWNTIINNRNGRF